MASTTINNDYGNNNLHFISISLSGIALFGVVGIVIVFVAHLCCKRRKSNKEEWTPDEPESTVLQTSTRPTCCEASMNTEISTSDGMDILFSPKESCQNEYQRDLKMPTPQRHPTEATTDESRIDRYFQHEKHEEGKDDDHQHCQNKAEIHSQSLHGLLNWDLEFSPAYKPQQTELDVAHQKVKKSTSWSHDLDVNRGESIRPKDVVYKILEQSDYKCAGIDHNTDLNRTASACASYHNEMAVPACPSLTPYIPDSVSPASSIESDAYELIDDQSNDVVLKLKSTFTKPSDEFPSEVTDSYYDYVDEKEHESTRATVFQRKSNTMMSSYQRRDQQKLDDHDPLYDLMYGKTSTKQVSVSSENQYNHLGEVDGSKPIPFRRTACTFPRLIAKRDIATNPSRTSHMYGKPCDQGTAKHISSFHFFDDDDAGNSGGFHESENQSSVYENPHEDDQKHEKVSLECIYGNTLAADDNYTSESEDSLSNCENSDGTFERSESNMDDGPKSSGGTSHECIYDDTVSEKRNTLCMKGSRDTSSIYKNPTKEEKKQRLEALYGNLNDVHVSKEDAQDDCIYDDTMTERRNTKCMERSGDISSINKYPNEQVKPPPESLYGNVIGDPKSQDENTNEQIYDNMLMDDEDTKGVKESGHPSSGCLLEYNQDKPRRAELLYDNLTDSPKSTEESSNECIYDDTITEKPTNDIHKSVNNSQSGDGPFKYEDPKPSPANDPLSFYENFDGRPSSHNMQQVKYQADNEKRAAKGFLKEEEKVQDDGEDGTDGVPMRLRHVYANLQHKRELLRQSLGIFPTGLAHPPPPPES